jgi:hypothetical protein
VAALTMVPWDSTCGLDCLQQSDALSCMGQSWWPALQQAICCVGVVAPSAHVAHIDVSTPTTTSNEVKARRQRITLRIVRWGSNPCQNQLEWSSFTVPGNCPEALKRLSSSSRQKGGMCE